MFLLPEGRAAFEKIHQKFGGGKRRLPVTAGADHQHDRLARPDFAKAVNDGQAPQRPAGFRLAGDALQLRFRHSGVMLKLQRGERARLVAAQADETDQRANVSAALRQSLAFGGGVERGSPAPR